MKAVTQIVLAYPVGAGSAGRRTLRRELSQALRISEFPVILDLSQCHSLDHKDIELLLDCVAQSTGRDTQLFLVAGSHVIRILLEVTRLSAIVPVFCSLEEALGQSPAMSTQKIESFPTVGYQQRWSA